LKIDLRRNREKERARRTHTEGETNQGIRGNNDVSDRHGLTEEIIAPRGRFADQSFEFSPVTL